MTDLAKLVVTLEAQTAQYLQKLEEAQKKLEGFQKQAEISAKGLGSAFAAVALASVTAFAAMGKAAIDNADHLNKISQETGIATEQLSQLQYAAQLSNVELEDLTKAFTHLSKVQVSAAKGSKDAVDAFKAIKVSATNADGTLRDSQDVLLDIADRFSKLSDGAGKAALAQEYFGKAGARMIPLLDKGREGITAMMMEADKLGLTLSGPAAQAAEDFNDNLTRLEAGGKGLANKVVQQVLPALVAITDNFIASAQAGGALDFAVKALSVTFKTFVTAGVIITSIFQQLGRVIYAAAAALIDVAQGKFSDAANDMTDAFEDVKSNVTNDAGTIAKIWGDQVPAMEKTADGMDKALKKSIVFNSDEAEKAAKKAADAATKALATMELGLMQQVATFGQTEAAVMQYRVTLGDLSDEVEKAGAAGKVYSDTIVALQERLDALKEKQKQALETQKEWNKMVEEAKTITESVATPAEKYGEQIDKLNKLLLDGLITQDTYNRAVKKAQDDFDKANKKTNKFLEEATRNVQDVLAKGIEDSLHDGVKKGAKGALDAFTTMLEKMAAQALAAKLAEKIFGSGGVGSGEGWIGKLLGGGGPPSSSGGNQWMKDFWGNMGSGGGGGSNAGGILDSVISLFAGSRDQGGRGKPGKAYRIGIDEEYYIPDTPGLFATPGMLRSGGTVNQNINVTGAVTQRSARQLQLEASRQQSIARARYS